MIADQYEDALCPECGTTFTGSREPGDMDYCMKAERKVRLQPANKNPKSHRVTDNDGPGAFGPEWVGTRFAIKRHRNGSRVPVAFHPKQPHRVGVVV